MKKNHYKNIVILGAGFAGLTAAKELAKDLDSKKYKITLIDKSDVHLYTPDLYEIAANFHEEITDECLTKLKDTVATKIEDTIDKEMVTFLQDKVTSIDPKKKIVKLENHKNLEYEMLVVALGSAQNYYKIPGLKQFSYPVKTIRDALVINCHLDTFFHFLWKEKTKKNVNITIGGGGATGVQFSSEMTSYLDKLCEKYHYPRKKVKVRIIQGGDELVGAGKRFSDLALERLKERGVEVTLSHLIVKAEPHKVTIRSTKDPKGKEKELDSDILIWTGGVMVNPLVQKFLGDPEHHGAMVVDKHMRSVEHEGIYAAGDCALFIDPKTKKSAPMLAQTAWEQGEVVAENIINKITHQNLIEYKIKPSALIVPIGGNWGLIKIGNFIFKGRKGWMARRFTDLLYAFRVLPFWRALKKWHHDTKIFMESD